MFIKVLVPSLRKMFLRLAGNRLLQHLLFWTASFLFLVNFFTDAGKAYRIDYIYTALFHISLLLAVYINIWVLVPGLLRKGQYLLYFIALPFLVAGASFLNQATFNNLVDLLLPEYYFISYYDLRDIMKFVFVYVALSGLLKLSKGWFMLVQAEQKLLAIQQEKTETELKALKSQINPHFLFNSLNNIYSLSLDGSKKTPDAILKLSELMRYMLYESNEDKVKIKQEIRFLENYIELQRLRSDQSSVIKYEQEGREGGQSIAPLIFLPFVENAFKHGVKGDPSGGYVSIRLAIDGSNIDLYVENNVGVVDKVEGEEFNGIGLSNVKRRLELIYPGNYELDIQTDEDNYRVNLKLDLR